jgi:hypothetical protein
VLQCCSLLARLRRQVQHPKRWISIDKNHQDRRSSLELVEQPDCTCQYCVFFLYLWTPASGLRLPLEVFFAAAQAALFRLRVGSRDVACDAMAALFCLRMCAVSRCCLQRDGCPRSSQCARYPNVDCNERSVLVLFGSVGRLVR